MSPPVDRWSDRLLVILILAVLALVVAHVALVVGSRPQGSPMPAMVQSVTSEEALPPVGMPRPVPAKLLQEQLEDGTLSDHEALYYKKVTK